MTSQDQYSAVVHAASEIVVLGAFGIEAVALIIQNRISLVISESKRINDTYIQNNQLGALRR
jgi:hypothetical protein